MKKLIVIAVGCLVIAVILIGIGLPVNATYKDLQNGVYGTHPCNVTARARYTGDENYPYVWEIETSNNSYAPLTKDESEIVSDTLIHYRDKCVEGYWMITKSQLKSLDKGLRNAVENGTIVKLRVQFQKDGYAKIEYPDFENIPPSWILLTGAGLAAFGIVFIFIAIMQGHQDYRDAHPLPKPVKTKLITVNNVSYRNTGGVIGRAAVGGMIGGEVGAMIGAASAKNRNIEKVSFLVFYDDGSKQVESESIGSPLYEKYMKILDTDN